MPLSFDQFAQNLAAAGLITAEELKAFLEGLPAERKANGEQLARELVKQKKLTGFQAQQIYAGKGKSLVMGNYLIVDKLGQGGMGMVLKAQHRKMKRLVALKMLSPAVTKSKEAKKRFQREVEAAAKLSHPNVVAAYDADESRGTHFLMMEYVEGTDLSALVKSRGPLPVERAIACVLQAARGLAYAHQQGIIHRDIKPSNLLLDANGKVKVLDMGLARLASDSAEEDQLTGTGQIMGTIDFMSPEQALDTRHADARADIYSLGMTLWFVLTGRPAYMADTVMKKIKAHELEPIPSLREICPEVPPELDAIFAKMVAKKPGERFQSMTEAVSDLERCLRSSAAGGGNAVEATELQEQIARQAAAGSAIGVQPSGTRAASPSLPFPTVTMQSAEDTLPETQSLMRPIVRPTGASRSGRNRKLLGVVGAVAVTVAVTVVVVAVAWRVTPKEKTPAKAPTPDGGNLQVVSAWHGWPAKAPAPAIAPFNREQAKKHRAEWAAYLKVPPEKENSLNMKLVLVPPGEFLMGAPPAEIKKAFEIATQANLMPIRKQFILTEAPRHKVVLTQPFYIGTCEVTQGQFEQLMSRNPSRHAPGNKEKKKTAGQDTSNHPVDSVNWKEVEEFCAKLSAQESLPPGAGYCLPTEAQWEYACRAGTSSEFWSGSEVADIERVAWYSRNSSDRTHPVGMKEANALGLYDVHGNVAEFVSDGFIEDYYEQFEGQEAIDPTGGPSGSPRQIFRGGDMTQAGYMIRSAKRFAIEEDNPINLIIGFRVVLPVKK